MLVFGNISTHYGNDSVDLHGFKWPALQSRPLSGRTCSMSCSSIVRLWSLLKNWSGHSTGQSVKWSPAHCPVWPVFACHTCYVYTWPPVTDIATWTGNYPRRLVPWLCHHRFASPRYSSIIVYSAWTGNHLHLPHDNQWFRVHTSLLMHAGQNSHMPVYVQKATRDFRYSGFSI